MAKKPTKQTKKTKSTEAAPKKTTTLKQLDETGRRVKSERRKNEKGVSSERRKTARRRQIDPTTCERDYTDAEIEFMHALDAYKRQSGRMFPTCSEILEVLGKLGYRKVETPAEQCCQHNCETISETAEEVEIAS